MDTPCPPLHAAARARDGRQLAKLLRIKAHASRVNECYGGRAALHVAVQRGTCSAAALRLLLATPGVDVNLPITCIIGSVSIDWITGQRALHLAAYHSPSLVRMLLQARGLAVNAVDARGAAAVHIAAQHQPECLEVLLAEAGHLGLDVRLRTNVGHTPLHYAAFSPCLQNDDCRALRALLRCDASRDINTRDADGSTPLHAAARKGAGQRVRVLLDAPGCEVECADGQKSLTPFHAAAMGEHTAGALRALLDHPASRPHINARDAQGQTPLHLAIDHGRLAHVRALLETPGCDACASDAQGRTPLHAAATAGDRAEALRMLLGHAGARTQLNARDARQRTPLLAALAKGAMDQVKVLTRCPGVDVNAWDADGHTPLHLALVTDEAVVAGGGNGGASSPFLCALLAHAPERFDVNAAPPLRCITPLAFCAFQSRLTAASARALLALPGVDPTRGCVESGTTPLHLAASEGNLGMVRLLLASDGVDVNAHVPVFGWTPLHVAARQARDGSVVREMIRCPRVDLDARDHRGMSPTQHLWDTNFDLLWDTKVCAACRREQAAGDCPPADKLLMCACGLCYYCDAACQRRAWPRHGRVCPKNKAND